LALAVVFARTADLSVTIIALIECFREKNTALAISSIAGLAL
jgi:hypothetical protein